MRRTKPLHSKEAIDSMIPKFKKFWTSNEATDFMTKVGYLCNGYYVPTEIDSELDYNKKYTERTRPSQKEIVRETLFGVFFGSCAPKNALESIKRDFVNYEYYVATSENDE